MPLSHHMVSPQLPSANPMHFADDANAVGQLLDALNSLAEPLGDPISQEELQQAIQAGLAAQGAYVALVRKANKKVMDWIEADPRHHGVLLMGRAYHTDAVTGHRIDEVLAGLGLAVISPTVITHQDAARIQHPGGANAWKKSSHMLRLSHYALEHPRVDVVALQSFGCLYDGLNATDAAEYFQRSGRIFTTLKIDEMSDIAHLRIRLRTLAENIEQIDLAQQETTPLDSQAKPAATNYALQLGAPLPASLLDAASKGSVEAFANLNATDIEVARSHTRDLCYSTAAVIGRALRILQELPQLERLTLPNICHQCVLEAVPSILTRITGRSPEIIWKNDWPVLSKEPETTSDAPLVGLIGTAPLVFDPFLNDKLVSTIKAHGCTPVLPQPEALFTDDVRYLDQLQRFYDMGVRHVVYLQSFGCLKGHVHVRGGIHDLSNRFPGMSIVVLDYDPEASALNRENRILLTLAAALGI